MAEYYTTNALRAYVLESKAAPPSSSLFTTRTQYEEVAPPFMKTSILRIPFIPLCTN